MHDNIVCGNEDGTKGCGEMFHLVWFCMMIVKNRVV